MYRNRLIIAGVVVEGRTHADVAAEFGVSRSWVTRLVARYQVEGDAAYEPKSRRPATSPTAISQDVVDLIISQRNVLVDRGLDAGPTTIAWHLKQHHKVVVSVASIWRYLNKAGLIVPAPRKKPKSAYIRFQSDLPNDTWQTDMTHWRLADDSDVEILSFIDDHSRLALSVKAYQRVNTRVVVDQFTETTSDHGVPASVLSDNGMYYTNRFSSAGKGKNRFEQLLAEQGVKQKNSAPNHPTTCGKVERFQQTTKKWLRARPTAETIVELQTQLDAFVDEYNNRRPHRSLKQRTPSVVYNLLPKAEPVLKAQPQQRVRYDRVDDAGKVTLRHQGRLYHIGIGRPHARTRVTMLVNGLDIRVIDTQTGQQIRHLTLDPNRNYQPQNNKRTP